MICTSRVVLLTSRISSLDPHITVYPSHVDVRTQLRYQQFDARFFGMITSCYDPRPDKRFSLEYIAFQASPESERVDIPLVVTRRVNGSSLASETLPVSLRTLVEEEKKLAEDHSRTGSAAALMHTLGVYQKNMSRVVEYHLDPTIRRLEEELLSRQKRYQRQREQHD